MDGFFQNFYNLKLTFPIVARKTGIAMLGIDCTIKTYQLTNFLSHLNNVKRSNSGYRAACPCCQKSDRDNALSIMVRDGSFHAYCHRCESPHKTIVHRAMGGALVRPITSKEVERKPKQPKQWRNRRSIEAIYNYTDEMGNSLYQKVRFEKHDKNGGRGAKYMLRHRGSDGTLYYGLGDNRRVIYNLPSVLSAETVYIVEGEKDADRLISLGLTATTNFDGAGTGKRPKWRDADYNSAFVLKDVVIIPDNDESGRAHAAYIAASLSRTAKSIKVINLPNLADGGDISDWLDAGHTPKDLEAIGRLTLPFDPLPQSFFKKATASQESMAVWFRRALPVTRKATPCDCGKCQKCTIVTIRADDTTISQMNSASRFECKTVQHKYTVRFVNQTATEQKRHDLHYHLLSYDEYQKWRERNKKRSESARYRPIHRADGQTFLITTDNTNGAEPLPTKPDDIYDLILNHIEAGHRTRRNVGTVDFGYNYQGSKGDGRGKSKLAKHDNGDEVGLCSQYFVKGATARDVAKTLGGRLKNGNARVQLDAEQVWGLLSPYELKRRFKKGTVDIVTLIVGDSPLRDIENQSQLPMSLSGENRPKTHQDEHQRFDYACLQMDLIEAELPI